MYLGASQNVPTVTQNPPLAPKPPSPSCVKCTTLQMVFFAAIAFLAISAALWPIGTAYNISSLETIGKVLFAFSIIVLALALERIKCALKN